MPKADYIQVFPAERVALLKTIQSIQTFAVRSPNIFTTIGLGARELERLTALLKRHE